ncbi:hypothetical protein EMPS_04077 [Entomortierella parvispora]|uniref:Uncharacterized protein n=1 Tax=Entomortierella parvispora TaxID=205924 RepID=A0A9P3H818_9FUNG|nr:hypothetical protein EMPS_04077 [Entomortierella parvispora]
MLPELKDLLVSPFISYAMFKVNPDYTTEHIITPGRYNEYPGYDKISDAVKAELDTLHIVQEAARYDGPGRPKVHFRLIVNNETVASMLASQIALSF